MQKEKQVNKRTVIKEEMREIVNNEKERIIYFAHDKIKVTDSGALEVIAVKYKKAGLDK